jgi:hypothetical protein
MTDLYIGLAITFAISAALLALGLFLGRRLAIRDAGLLIMFSVLLLLAYQKFAWDQVWLTRIFPFSNAVIVANFYPPLVAFMAGICWRRIPSRSLRKGLLLVPLVVLSWLGVVRLLVTRPPIVTSRWSGRVCRQTSNASCSAAAGATLLRSIHISSSEREMADLCLTRPDGTSMLGLYRGLKLKLAGTAWKPVALDVHTVEELRAANGGPYLLSVELEPGTPNIEMYEDWGWGVGSRHSVVLFRFLPSGYADMGDPATGHERWTIDDLRVLWHGEGFRLASR